MAKVTKKRTPYSPEFRRRMVELVRSGKSPEELEKEFEPSSVTIRNWVAKADIAEGKHSGLCGNEKAELLELRRQNKILREEREILKKAAAWFAQEAGTVRLDGGEIKKIEKRGEVFRFSSPPLLLGSHNLMISVFFQDRRMASSLLEAISNLSKKLYDNSLKLESETDPETRGELMRENENLNSQISDMRIKLSGIRRLIGLKQMNNILVE